MHDSLAHRAVGALRVPAVPPEAPALDVTAAQLAEVADRLYEGIEHDKALRPKFGSDLAGERTKLAALLVEVFLGEPRWNAAFVHQTLAASHRIIHITAHDAAAWLGHARRAAVAVLGDVVAGEVVGRLRPVAEALVNEAAPAPAGAKREARFRPMRDAIAACGKGDVALVRELFDAHPHLAECADLLLTAVAKGRIEVVRALLDRGVDVNRPAVAGPLMVTPLCEARRHDRRAIVDVLVDAGAIDDAFGAAYLGDVAALEALLDADPALVGAVDPASDFHRASLLDHAVLGVDPVPVVRLLAERGAPAPLHGGALLRHAAERGLDGVVEQLLGLGADASHVTPGRWVLHRASAERLLAAGADVNHAPTRWQSWIWISCNGNNGRRDDPELVRALVAAGADVGARAFDGKTGLHFAARAGFVGVAGVLLEAGADPNAVDDDGSTPMTYVARSGARADREAMSRLLERFGGR